MAILRTSDELLPELFEFLRIPSVSSGDGDPADLERGAEWVCERVREAGGEAALHDYGRNPVAVGTIRCGRPEAPHVLVYGHYDVQTVAPLGARHSRIQALSGAKSEISLFMLAVSAMRGQILNP